MSHNYEDTIPLNASSAQSDIDEIERLHALLSFAYINGLDRACMCVWWFHMGWEGLKLLVL
jgi:hypothetical protein